MWFAYTTVLEGRRKGQTLGSGNQLLVAEGLTTFRIFCHLLNKVSLPQSCNKLSSVIAVHHSAAKLGRSFQLVAWRQLNFHAEESKYN